MARMLVDLDVVVKIETALAYGIEDPDGGNELIWMPKSQCELDGDTLTCPEWLAKEKGLI